MMECINPHCGAHTIVRETFGVYRKRKCSACERVFLTVETPYELQDGYKNPMTRARDARYKRTAARLERIRNNEKSQTTVG